jgi:hypothetical protein
MLDSNTIIPGRTLIAIGGRQQCKTDYVHDPVPNSIGGLLAFNLLAHDCLLRLAPAVGSTIEFTLVALVVRQRQCRLELFAGAVEFCNEAIRNKAELRLLAVGLRRRRLGPSAFSSMNSIPPGYEGIRGGGHGQFELANWIGSAKTFGGLGATNALRGPP